MDVIPYVLTEVAASKLPDRFLKMLADCTTDKLKPQVIKYLESEDADPEVKTRVRAAYYSQISVDEFLHDDKTKDAAALIRSLDYSDIGLFKTVEQLESYKQAIEYILESDKAVPYIAPVAGSAIKTLKEELAEYNKENGKDPDITTLLQKLNKYSVYFKDKRTETYRGTVVKSVIRDREKFMVMLRGIDFVINAQKSNALPGSWRYL